MKKLSLLLIVMMSLVQMAFGQAEKYQAASKQIEGALKITDIGCDCSGTSRNISTGFNEQTNSVFNDDQRDYQFRTTSSYYVLPTVAKNSNGTNIRGHNGNGTNPVYWASSNANSAWVLPEDSDEWGALTFTYKYSFNIPATKTGTLRFKRIGADNEVKVYLDNTNNLIYSSNKNNYAFTEANATLSQCLVVPVNTAGTHILIYEVINKDYTTGFGNITGLLVEACLELNPLIVNKDPDKAAPYINKTPKVKQ